MATIGVARLHPADAVAVDLVFSGVLALARRGIALLALGSGLVLVVRAGCAILAR
ncbi:MAG: hypothetical protein ACRD2D_01740 [Terriglobales bacterium]